METVSIAAALNRMNSCHAQILAALDKGEKVVGPSTSSAEIRGYRVCLKTLSRWDAIKDGALTAFGADLLTQWNARRTQ